MIPKALAMFVLLATVLAPPANALIGGKTGQQVPAYLGLPLPCSGTKIAKRFILTAAHCVSSSDGKDGVMLFYDMAYERTIGVTGLYSKQGLPGVKVNLNVVNTFVHPSWVTALQKFAKLREKDPKINPSVSASFDEGTSDIALLEVEANPDFDRIPVAPLGFTLPVEGADLTVAGINRSKDWTIHASKKKRTTLYPTAFRLSREDADGKSLSTFFKGDSGGGVYDGDGRVVGVAVGVIGRTPTDDEKELINNIVGKSPEELDKISLDTTGYQLLFDEFLHVLFSDESNVVRIDDLAVGPWLRSVVGETF